MSYLRSCIQPIASFRISHRSACLRFFNTSIAASARPTRLNQLSTSRLVRIKSRSKLLQLLQPCTYASGPYRGRVPPSTSSASLLSSTRRRLNRLNGGTIVFYMIGLNLAIFGVWAYAQANLERFRDGRLLATMLRNFSLSERNLREGRM